jgi:hypothetical protein
LDFRVRGKINAARGFIHHGQKASSKKGAGHRDELALPL